MDADSLVAKVMYVLGIIEIIGGFILGIIFGNVEVGSYGRIEFSFSIFMLWVAGSLVSGLMLMGFSQVIKLLEENASNTSNIIKRIYTIEKKIE